MIAMSKSQWDEEFENAVEHLRAAWRDNNIKDYLMTHSKFHMLITNKVQEIIDEIKAKPIKKEISLNIDPKSMEKLEALNISLNRLFSSLDTSITGEPNEPEAQRTSQHSQERKDP